MNLLLWVAAGSVLAWIGYTYLGLNKGRSMPISIAIGAPGVFSITDLLFAMSAAVVCLAIDSLFYRHWGA